MRIYSVKLTKRAQRDLDNLNKNLREKIVVSLEIIAVNPFAEVLNFKKLKGGKNLYRVRIGDYRIIYEIYGNELIIIVIRIGHRKDVYEYLKN